MSSLAPREQPELWHGAVAWTESPNGHQPWRLLPHECDRAYAPELTQRARIAAGVRLEGRTGADGIRLELTTDGEGSVDLCIDRTLTDRVPLRRGRNDVTLALPAGEHDVCVWLPQWGTTQVGAVDADAPVIRTPQRPRWVTYGSSITMCRTADGPSETWPAIVTQRLGWDLTCLGFGGQCHLDPAVVRTVATVEADVISACLGINVYGAGSFGPRTWSGQVYEFLRRLQEGHPAADLVVISPIACPDREHAANAAGLTLARIRAEVEQVAHDLGADSSRVHLIDGLEVLGAHEAEELLADRLHPTPDGYRLMGHRIARLMSDLPLESARVDAARDDVGSLNHPGQQALPQPSGGG